MDLKILATNQQNRQLHINYAAQRCPHKLPHETKNQSPGASGAQAHFCQLHTPRCFVHSAGQPRGGARAQKRIQHDVAFCAEHFDEAVSDFSWVGGGSSF